MLFFVFVVLPNQQEIAIPQQNKVNGINTGKNGLHLLLDKTYAILLNTVKTTIKLEKTTLKQ